jgi:NAD(P)-dependent dehydrogenase (short-subunit alcohol dehydrogenase family)
LPQLYNAAAPKAISFVDIESPSTYIAVAITTIRSIGGAMRLTGKVTLVTGAAQGIGEVVVRTFAKEGARIFIADVKDDKGKQVAQEIEKSGGKASFIHLDVTQEDSWKQAIQSVTSQAGRLDITVNNAGISKRMPFEEFPVEVWDQMMAVNVRGVFLGMKHSIPAMRKGGGGCIINMSSIAGLVGHKTSSIAYIATKAAVNMMSKGVAVQFAKDKIRVNTIHPCTVATPLVEDLFRNPEMKKARFEEVPMGRIATEQDVANAAVFLASEEANFITGVSLPVDGGLTAY